MNKMNGLKSRDMYLVKRVVKKAINFPFKNTPTIDPIASYRTDIFLNKILWFTNESF